MKLENITETKHEELLKLLNPLIDFMTENKFNYFLVAGKDDTCTRHMRGDFYEVTGMLTGMIENNKQVGAVLEYSVNEAAKAIDKS